MSVQEKSLSVVDGNQSLSSFNREEIDTIKRTVARGVTDAELKMFLTICGRYQLDPFLKEIWCYKRQKKGQDGKYLDDPNAPAIITTSRDGYLKIAQRDPEFDGIKSFVVREGDTFEIDAMTDQVVHKFGPKRTKILGAWAAVYHKNRRPVIVYAEFDEYQSNSNIWRSYPSAMIQKVAESLALKRQFGVSGLVTQEELDITVPQIDDGSKPEHNFKQIPSDYQADPKAVWLEKANALKAYATEKGMTDQELRGLGKRLTGKVDIKTWSAVEMERIQEYLSSFVAAAEQELEGTQSDGDTAGNEEAAEADGEFKLPDDKDLPF